MQERSLDQLLPAHTITGNRTHNLGMCLDQGLNLQSFDMWDDTATHWATWPGQEVYSLSSTLGHSVIG